MQPGKELWTNRATLDHMYIYFEVTIVDWGYTEGFLELYVI